MCELWKGSVTEVINTVALVGAPVTFYCASDSIHSCAWFRFIGEGSILICAICEKCLTDSVLPPFVFNPTPQGCNLVIPAASFDLAGIYMGGAQDFTFLAGQLFVLGRILKNGVN